MFDKLKQMKSRYLELTDKLASPDVIANQQEWQKVAKEHSALTEIIVNYDAYLKAESTVEECNAILSEEIGRAHV